ncbi:ArnT family glycosyltransferase [Nocardia acidivorans]|uniref:ArnT family glycosyltransferase n=1 Tax=Nocardia acidivorans TaxID=404580 RepID=UPI00147223E7|nr:glycosyltransferase family 39 protein [Nocardia acidivorans]
MLVSGFVLCLRAGRYGYFGDELYFLSAGRRLAAGYVDQGPLVPLLARAAEWVAPGSAVVLRIPAVACGIAAIWICAGVAREFGGGWAAQRLAALGIATSPMLITAAASLSTFAVDGTLAAALLWILLRWVRIRDDRLLLGAAVVAAVDLQVKLLLPVLALGIAVGVLSFGPRSLFRRPALWAALVVVGLSVVPGLCWQADHGWPQWEMGAIIADEQRAATGGVAGLPIQAALLLGVLGTLLAGAGVWALLRSTAVRPYRFVAVAAVLQLVFVVVTQSRPYYLAGVFPVLLAAGAVWWAEPEPRRWWRGMRLTAGVSAGIALAVVLVLPLPRSALHDPTGTRSELSTRMRLFGVTGWNELAAAVTAQVETLTPSDRAHTVVVTRTYWQAAALDDHARDLPPVYSANRGFAYFGFPSHSETTVLYIGSEGSESLLRDSFSEVRVLTRLDSPLGFPGITRHVVLWRCDHPRRPWQQVWPDWRTNVLDSGEGTTR